VLGCEGVVSRAIAGGRLIAAACAGHRCNRAAISGSRIDADAAWMIAYIA